MKKGLLIFILIVMIILIPACNKNQQNGNHQDDNHNDIINNTPKTFDVKFNVDGNIINLVKVNSSEKVSKPSDPTKEGYNFLYWEIDGKEYNFDLEVTDNLILTAKWERIRYISEGLVYSFNEDFTCSVVGVGTFNDENLILPITIDYNENTYTVTSIGKGAFKNCSNLISIDLPNNIVSIDEDAFSNCDNLTNVYYTGTVEDWCKIKFLSKTSTPMAYADNFYILNSLDNWDLINEIKIPDAISSIGDFQFYGFNGISNIEFSTNILNTGKLAFGECVNLTNVYYTGTIEDWCKINFSDYNMYSTPMSYAKKIYMLNADNEFTLVEEIIIPNTVEKVGNYQFYGFKDVEKIIIPSNVVEIQNRSFNSCEKLEIVEIPGSVKKIGNCAFTNSINLNKVYYNGTLEDWCNTYFSSWDSYSNPMNYATSFYMLDENNKWNEVTDIKLPDPGKIESYKFISFENLETIIIPKNTFSKSPSFYECTGLKNVYYEGTLEDWCSSSFITLYLNPMYYAEKFYLLNGNNEWYEVTDIIIPDSITKIGDYQFYGFENLQSVKFPNSLEMIDSHVFEECISLKSIEIPATVTLINYSAFSNCKNLESVTFEKDSQLERIEARAFLGCESLLSIEIPSSVTSIGCGAFASCESLASITVPFVGAALNGEENTHFGYIFGAEHSFVNSAYIRDSLKTVIITGGEFIKDFAFEKCSMLTTIVIADGVTRVGYYSFTDCQDATFYCEASSQPDNWSEDWNAGRPVVWDYKIEEN